MCDYRMYKWIYVVGYMVMNIIVIIISALILAIIRVVLIFYSNSRR